MNPNTVLKAYRHLEHEGLVGVRQGVGALLPRDEIGGVGGGDPGRPVTGAEGHEARHRSNRGYRQDEGIAEVTV